MAVLAVSLLWLVEATTQAISAENHAKMVTTATFLARRQLVEREDALQEKGFNDEAFASETVSECDPDSGAFKRFKCSCLTDKIQLPGTDVIQTLMGSALTGAGSGGTDSNGNPMGGIAGLPLPGLAGLNSGNSTASSASSMSMLTSQFGIVKDILEQGIRKATCKVTWTEHGADRAIEVSEYLTDPKRIDQSFQMPTLPTGGIPGMNGAAGNGMGSVPSIK